MKSRSDPRFLLEGAEGTLLLVIAVVTWPVSRRWLRNWGSRPTERERDWPGDHLLPSGAFETTRAVTIAAPVRSVWKYVVQFGLGRAGFYSYELLERVGRIPVRNVESVEPAWQSLSVGDEILLHPENGVRISKLAEARSICFGKRTHQGNDVGDGSWSIYLEPVSDDVTRLVVRACIEALDSPTMSKRIARGFEQVLDFVMEQRMLRTIKRLSEAAPTR